MFPNEQAETANLISHLTERTEAWDHGTRSGPRERFWSLLQIFLEHLHRFFKAFHKERFMSLLLSFLEHSPRFFKAFLLAVRQPVHLCPFIKDVDPSWIRLSGSEPLVPTASGMTAVLMPFWADCLREDQISSLDLPEDSDNAITVISKINRHLQTETEAQSTGPSLEGTSLRVHWPLHRLWLNPRSIQANLCS